MTETKKKKTDPEPEKSPQEEFEAVVGIEVSDDGEVLTYQGQRWVKENPNQGPIEDHFDAIYQAVETGKAPGVSRDLALRQIGGLKDVVKSLKDGVS